jgi:PAS domain S-box-containing protein
MMTRERLLEQKQHLEPLLEISPTAIVITDLDAIVVAWNPAAERLFGYTGEEAVGQNLDDLVAKTEELHQAAVAYSDRTLRKDHIHTITRRTRKDGSLIDVEVLAAPVLVDGEAVGTFGIYHDITELQRQKRYYEALVQASPTAIATVDTADVVTSWNPAAERLFGYSAEEAVGRNVDELVANRDDIRDEALRVSREIASGEIHLTTRRSRKDGSLVDVDVVGAPIYVGGERVGMHAFYHDISEIQRQRRYYEALVELSPVAIVTLDRDNKVTSWNPAAEQLFGYSVSEAMGQDLDSLIAHTPEIREEALRSTKQGLSGKKTRYISQRNRKDGTLVDVEMIGTWVTLGGDALTEMLIYHDVTEIQRQRRYYETLVERSPVAVVLIDMQGDVTSWNPAAERLFGYTSAEAVGRNIDDLVGASEEIRSEAETYTERGMRGEAVRALTQRTRKDGTLVDVEMFGAPVIVAGEHEGFYGLYHDITELQQARKDAEGAAHAKSAFLATMSHEIRTPLNAVIGMTGLLLDTQLAAEQRNYAEVIRSSGDALLAVINEILDFSKIEAGRLDLEQQPFDLRQCLESALELVANQAAEKDLDLAYVLDADAPGAVVGDVTRLRQILLNLLNNAMKFTERGEVVLTADAERLTPDGGEKRGRYRLHIAVRDTGIGIPEDRMDRLFESFSQIDASTTRRYGGTGLGLAISKRLAELMGGTMWVESRAGEGSTFHFTIEAQGAPAPVPAYSRGALPQLQGRRVLIVDDNATNREILRRQTGSWGMVPRDTGSPREALEWVRSGERFDLAILDMHMPEMDGLTLARELRVHPSAEALPLVMLTSLGRREAEEDVVFAAHLTKPIRPSQLYDALSEILGEHPAHAPVPAAPEGERLGDRLPLRILVAEDNAVNQQLALLLLQKLGYRADMAADGREALEALERQPYDVVLMDVHMPEMDGLEATRRIRQRWTREEAPRIIAMTANALEGDRELCLQAGMDDYVSKPIRPEELSTALARSEPRETEPVLEPAALGRLRETVGGEEDLAELVALFLQDSARLVGELRRSVEAGRTEEARRHAHTLKSTAASFGASRLTELCRRIEALAEGGTVEEAVGLMAGVDAEFSRVRVALTQGQ